MKFFISSTVLSLLTIQVFLSCNCQIILFPFNEVINFNPSNATYKILKSSDFTSFKALQSIFYFGNNAYSSTTASLKSVNTSDLAKSVIENNVQIDLTKIMNALNSIAISLVGCIPQISYPNDLNISNSCFSFDCISTPVKCQALYLQNIIDELELALSKAESNLNLTSSILVGNTWNYPSLLAVTTQWSIVQASAAAYQNSTTIGPLIRRVNSNFKKVFNAALNGTILFLNSFSNGYKTLINDVNSTSYNQTADDSANLVLLSITSSAEKSLLTDDFNFNGIVVKSSSTQSTINGISIASFVRPAAILVFEKLDELSSSFNKELDNFQNNFKSLTTEQGQNLTNIIVSGNRQAAQSCGPQLKSSFSGLLKDHFQSVQNTTANLITNYTNLIDTYTNMATDCFKVACADNIIYPFSLWKLQCVNDISFTSFCWSEKIPITVQRCPSAKAETLNACLDDVTSMITSLQPASDLEVILENTKNINPFFKSLSGYSACVAISSIDIIV